MGRATDKGDEFPPPHGTPQGQGSRPNHNTAHRSKKRSLVSAEGQKQTKADGRAISTPPVSAGIGQRGEHVRYVHHKRP